ncbi:MAG: ribosomal RNA small subunit methyltransferase A [Candidatus Portnoybacteria bacterium]|nr:ribosomal RNA small subunit methyltransferase A [Candidatus Portnoybacteria bacterium]
MNKTTIKNLLQQYHLRPSKRLGQNFLISQKVLQKIIQTANLSKKDIVLEIGPGLGILTQELAEEARKVIAVEKDKRMVEILKDVLRDYKNVEIIAGDILKIQGLPLGGYKLVANIPYYLTSPLIRLFLESPKPPQEMILLIQKEVAQRICGRPPKMSLLAVAVQFYSQPKIISYVSKKSFWPQPKVDSAIIKISNIKKPKNNIKKFFQIVKAGFSSPRKQLVNNLSQKLNLERQEIKTALVECRLDIQVRAENLSVEDWINLYASMDRH